MKTKEEILKDYNDHAPKTHANWKSEITFEGLLLETLADIRDGQNKRLDGIIDLLREIEYFERTKK